MTTSVITWKALPPSAALSTIAVTMLGQLQQVNAYLVSLAADPNCHWQVCSTGFSASPYHVALKRKSGAPGRILLVGISASVALGYNPQLRNISWVSSGIRMAYFPGATSDVPANILAGSGDVFTNPNNCTGMTANMNNYVGTTVLTAYSCEEGLILRLHTPGGAAIGHWVAGELAVDVADNAASIAGYVTNFSEPVIVTAALTTGGYWSRFDDVSCFVGNIVTYPIAPSTVLRNHALKKSGYLPFLLGTMQSTMERVFLWKLRQIAQGPAPLAADEIINMVDGGVATPKAISISPTTAHIAWLTNFKF